MGLNNQTGNLGESLAISFLQQKEFTILHTNFRHGRFEVDIIAQKDKVLHIFEVKTKAGKGLGQPEQRVDTGKINRMKRVAEHYCYENPGWQMVQFNIIAIELIPGEPEKIFMIEDVF